MRSSLTLPSSLASRALARMKSILSSMKDAFPAVVLSRSVTWVGSVLVKKAAYNRVR